MERLVRFGENDPVQADFRQATVVTLFLLRSVNLKLRPKLLNELSPARGWSRTPSTWGTGNQRRNNRCQERTMTKPLISATSFSFGRFLSETGSSEAGDGRVG